MHALIEVDVLVWLSAELAHALIEISSHLYCANCHLCYCPDRRVQCDVAAIDI